MQIDARVMDAAGLDFDAESFDCVVLHLILAVVPDPHTTAREAARVLRRGGRASVFDKFAMGKPSLGRRALNVIANAVATDITRSLPEVLRDTELEVVREEASVFGGVFRVAVLTRAGNTRAGR